jgi:hypothetical protein
LLARGFSKTELQANWESVVKDRANLAVNIMVNEGKQGPVDVLKWLILMAMDISTRVVFGEEYKILETRKVGLTLHGNEKLQLIDLGNRAHAAASVSS